MKRNRMMLKRKKRRGTMILVALFCMILPIIAIYIGLRITELWVSPALNSDYNFVVDEGNRGNNSENTHNTNNTNKEKGDEEKPIAEDKAPKESGSQGQEEDSRLIEKEVKPLSIYTIQIASLSDNKRVEGLIQELNERKLSNLIYKEDSSFKVYVVGGTKRSQVEQELQYIRSFYPDAYINEVHPSIQVIEYPEGDDVEVYSKIVEDINKIIELMELQGEEWYNFYEKEGELGTYIELLKKQQEVLVELDENLRGIDLPQSFPVKEAVMEKMIAYQNNNINRSIEIISAGHVDNLHQIHSLYLDSLFRVVELIK
ncbi:hypothetical protein [Alkaliphilus hydrothermalis]|uniref:Sporulation related domain-containing protein n=1 Tax=Alkaliphilus hydrothermalis TaxID=1482730 RepID=A0ABS2NL51_9FIRM|nr:hypothetical protein [Alkaliphilus hydrothermalis]MBM7613562.1 hypothetical protein [Alkaliphilus hydrothermalis]